MCDKANVSACDCISNEPVPWRLLDQQYGEGLLSGDEALPEQPCRGCMRPTSGGGLLAMTPCMLRPGFHNTVIGVCDAKECEMYAWQALNEYGATRHNMMYVARCTTEARADAVTRGQERLESLFSYDLAHACTRPECRRPAWRMADGTLTHKRCGRCKRVWYCNAQCQREHHSTHKEQCVRGEVAPPFTLEVPPDMLAHESASAIVLAAGFAHNDAGVCAETDCFVRLHPGGGCALEKALQVRSQTEPDQPGRQLRFCSVACSLVSLVPLVKCGSVQTGLSGLVSSSQ